LDLHIFSDRYINQKQLLTCRGRVERKQFEVSRFEVRVTQSFKSLLLYLNYMENLRNLDTISICWITHIIIFARIIHIKSIDFESALLSVLSTLSDEPKYICGIMRGKMYIIRWW